MYELKFNAKNKTNINEKIGFHESLLIYYELNLICNDKHLNSNNLFQRKSVDVNNFVTVKKSIEIQMIAHKNCGNDNW